MEKKTAIVVINNTHFDSDKILAYNNVERIAWFAQLVDEDVTINDPELVTVFDTAEAYCREYNAGCMRSEVFDLVAIEYTEKVDGKFHNPHYPIGDLSMRLCVKVVEHNQNDEDLQVIAMRVREKSKERFGSDVQCFVSGYWNDNNDYRLHVYLSGDKCRILNNLHPFLFDTNDCYGVAFCEPEWSVDGIDLSAIKFEGDEDEYNEGIMCPTPEPEPIKVENPKVTDTDTLAPQMEARPEEVKENPKYDGEFLEHIATIFEEGRKILCVELSGEKHVINGLFTNEDVIIDCYIADTMQRIDRYFVIGAQDKPINEARYYTEHFMERVAKDRYINECWYLTETQFKFLKEA